MTTITIHPRDGIPTASPESTLAAATLIACRPEGYTHDSVADAACRLVNCQRDLIADLQRERDAAVRDEADLRRHFKAHLERMRDLILACVSASGDTFAEWVAELGAEVEVELRGLSE